MKEGVGATLVAAAAIVFVVWVMPALRNGKGGSGNRPELERLIAEVAKQENRPFEGRLTGGFVYGRQPSALRNKPKEGTGTDAFGEPLSPEVEAAAARIAESTKGRTSADARVALGAAQLVTGKLDGAITTLEQVTSDLPNDAAARINLSAAYLTRAGVWNRREDWSKALAAAERAMELDRDAPEAYFNRAVALEGLGDKERAARAWDDYTARDRDSNWAREAERRKKKALEP